MHQIGKVITTAMVAINLVGCSSSIDWKEEVPLNSGKSIWIKRTAVYERVLTGPLALELGWEVKKESMEFEWSGRGYKFVGEVAPDYLLIDPDSNAPVLISSLEHVKLKKRFGCRKPFYVEYRFGNNEWLAQAQVDEKFFGAKPNLMRWRENKPEMPSIVSAAQREQKDFERFNWGAKGVLRADFFDPNCREAPSPIEAASASPSRT